MNGTDERSRVLVAERDQPTRAGLRLLLTHEGFDIAGEAIDAREAVDMAIAERPDVVLVAAELPGGGIEAARRIAAEVARARLVVLTSRPSGEELVEAVMAGAVGYLSRNVRVERLPAILQGVLAGEVALPRRHSRHLVEALRRQDARRSQLAVQTDAVLSDREWEVLQLVADGLATGEMSRRLGITEVTTRRHISSVMAKLGVSDRAGAAELLRRSSR
jgi:DNA-binding NarL/FixJ family response regulator